MARSLMTPDELRRMDNDLCIIFEKGIKPIKANKYYYFKYPEAKLVEKYPADHNDVQVQRTPWRKYNPMNPYEEGDEGNAEDFPSLDSLFDDEDNAETSGGSGGSSKSSETLPGMEALEESYGTATMTDTKPVKKDVKKDTTDIDIQKELEAKFDELFGSLDDDDDDNV